MGCHGVDSSVPNDLDFSMFQFHKFYLRKNFRYKNASPNDAHIHDSQSQHSKYHSHGEAISLIQSQAPHYADDNLRSPSPKPGGRLLLSSWKNSTQIPQDPRVFTASRIRSVPLHVVFNRDHFDIFYDFLCDYTTE